MQWRRILAGVLCSMTFGVRAWDESLELRCSVVRSTREAGVPQLKIEVPDEHLFVTISAKNDNSLKRLVISIQSDHFIGSGAYYSWSEGSNPDIVTADVGKYGWKATRRRKLSGGEIIYGQISIDRRSGVYSEDTTFARDGVTINERLSVGRCQPTREWADKSGFKPE